MKSKINFEKTKKLLGELAVPVFFVLLILLDYVFRYFYHSASTRQMPGTDPLIFTFFWALLLSGIALLLPRKLRRFYMPIVLFLNIILCCVHGVMYNLFGNFFSVSDLYFAGDGAKFFSFTYVVIRKGFLCFAALAMVAIIIVSVLHRPEIKEKRIVLRLLPGILALVLGIGGIAFRNAALLRDTNQTVSWAQNTNIKKGDIYKEMSDVNKSMYICGIYQYIWRSFTVSTGLGDSLKNGETYKLLDDYFANSPKREHPANSMSGVLEGKNCFFILLESIDSWLLTDSYMPNLYALKEKSVDFTDHYSTLYVSAATFNTEFIANTGQIPPSSGLDTRSFVTSDFPTSLARLFAAKGYTARSFHSADPTIYNRGNVHINLGYEAYYYWPNIGMDDYRLDSQLTRGFDKMTEKKPFFTGILTFSGHGPYTEEFADISAPHMEAASKAVAESCTNAKALADPEYTRAVAHAMETDAFVGNLVEELEKSGLAEDTVLVFYTDHYSKYITDTELVRELKAAENMDLICKTPFFIYSPSLDAQKVTRVTSTPDIAPTLANMFGLDVNYACYPGFDAFGSDAGIFADGRGVAVFRSGAWYDGSTYSPEPAPETAAWLDAAWKVMRCNYFAH